MKLVRTSNGATFSRLGRLGQNDSLFREVNDRLRELAAPVEPGAPPRLTQYLCECADDACLELIELTPEEYETIRSYRAAFVVFPGHESREANRVLERNDRFVLVERTGYFPESPEAA